MRNSLRLVSLVLVAGTAAACNQVETGRNGRLTFTPDDCGQLSCSFGDRLAVGGVTDVTVSGVKAGTRTDDLRLVSSAPWVFDVQPGAFGHAELVGLSEGSAQLLAIDPYGDTVDYITVDVAQIDDLDIAVIGEGVQGPDTIVGADARYRVRAGTAVSLRVTPTSTAWSVMGDVQYDVEMTEGLAFAIRSDSDVARGKIDFVAPAGEHELFIGAPGGAWKKIHFSVQ